jgi:hypothetical protein
MRQLIGYGQPIESDFPVHGALLSEGGARRARGITIRRLAEVTNRGIADVIYQLTNDGLIFSPPGVAHYRCSASQIGVRPQAGADQDEIADLLVATALPAVLWLQTRLVLHAAGTVLPGSDRAIAIAGPSGAGKSTVVAQLVAHGACLLGDDTMSVSTNGEVLSVSGLPGGYFLPRAADGTRIFKNLPRLQSTVSSEIGAILVLEQAPQDHSSIERLDPLGAIERLLANQHRSRIPALLGRRGEVVRICAAIANSVPVLRWRRRKGQAELDQYEREVLMETIELGRKNHD